MKINPFVSQSQRPSMPFTIHVVSMLCWYIGSFANESFFMYFLSFGLVHSLSSRNLEGFYLLMASLNVFTLGH